MSSAVQPQSEPLGQTAGNKSSVAVVGGGLGGLSAACALADAGFKVTLFERRPFLGGRASSYQLPGSGEVVDNCQHVLLGCCTNLLDFYRRIGVEDLIHWFADLTFIEPGGRRSTIRPSLLPAPFHSTPSFLRVASLSYEDKTAIARGLMAIAWRPRHWDAAAETGENFMAWLQRHGQTERAIDRFWKVVLVSALNEDLDRISVPYAAQVFRESFLNSAAAGAMGLPTVPLTQLYNAAEDYIRQRGGEVLLRTTIDSFQPGPQGVNLFSRSPNQGDDQKDAGERSAKLGVKQRFDFAIMAVPFDVLARMLPRRAMSSGQEDSSFGALSRQLQNFEFSPITGIHLWFDREITDLDHAVLLDRTIQWMFNKSKIRSRLPQPVASRQRPPAEFSSEAPAPEGVSHYIELVVSASKLLVDKSRAEILEMGMRELGEFFPAVKDARLLKGTVIKEVHATYSARPRSDLYRPAAATAWPRVFLAGDWTATGWPATMEGAVRSGYKAAEALVHGLDRKDRFVAPDMQPRGFMRWMRK